MIVQTFDALHRDIEAIKLSTKQVNQNDDTVDYIAYHEPAGPGDNHFCDVHYIDGTMSRHFDLVEVYFMEDHR